MHESHFLKRVRLSDYVQLGANSRAQIKTQQKLTFARGTDFCLHSGPAPPGSNALQALSGHHLAISELTTNPLISPGVPSTPGIFILLARNGEAFTTERNVFLTHL